MPALVYLLTGLGVAVVGTLVGAGGGFLAVPLLLLVFRLPPHLAVGTSLTMVFFSACSGSTAYARQGKVDFHTGLRLAAATMPGSLAGAYLSDYLPGATIRKVFGAALLLVSAFILLRPETGRGRRGPAVDRTEVVRTGAVRTAVVRTGAGSRAGQAEAAGREPSNRPGQDDRLSGFRVTVSASGWHRPVSRRLKDGTGLVHVYAFDENLGLLVSVVVGMVSSILGIGGGIIHVPALIYLLNFPPHVATATSSFILALSAAVGAVAHYHSGHVLVSAALPLAAGAVCGAPLGAALSRKVRSRAILTALAGCLALVAARLLDVF